jgi:hypothetical protein
MASVSPPYFLFGAVVSITQASTRAAYLNRLADALATLGWTRDSSFGFSKKISTADAVSLSEAEEQMIDAAVSSLSGPVGDDDSPEVVSGRVSVTFNGSLRVVISE